MINDLLTWQESCSEGDLCLRLKQVRLKVPMGGFPRGILFAWAVADFKQGTLTLHTYDGFEHVFHMKVIFRADADDLRKIK